MITQAPKGVTVVPTGLETGVYVPSRSGEASASGGSGSGGGGDSAAPVGPAKPQQAPTRIPYWDSQAQTQAVVLPREAAAAEGLADGMTMEVVDGVSYYSYN